MCECRDRRRSEERPSLHSERHDDEGAGAGAGTSFVLPPFLVAFCALARGSCKGRFLYSVALRVLDDYESAIPGSCYRVVEQAPTCLGFGRDLERPEKDYMVKLTVLRLLNDHRTTPSALLLVSAPLLRRLLELLTNLRVPERGTSANASLMINPSHDRWR